MECHLHDPDCLVPKGLAGLVFVHSDCHEPLGLELGKTLRTETIERGLRKTVETGGPYRGGNHVSNRKSSECQSQAREQKDKVTRDVHDTLSIAVACHVSRRVPHPPSSLIASGGLQKG